jgi:hypothetical protein
MLSPIDASARIRNGIMITLMKKSDAISGTSAKAPTRINARPILSCRIGNTAWSA